MTDQDQNTPIPEGSNVSTRSIVLEMKESYLTYALSVIKARALPDVRDGLKPSQRRILVAMNDLNLGPRAKYRKCAKIAGDTSGNYHPHGEAVVYPTMVRMAQDFSLRYPLVDGQGNFGSVDGDPPAAMRYTEVRMTKLAEEMLGDIEKQTVDWQENYDGNEQEPTVLPCAFPNLLVNGSGGIAVGMATNMPPHNLREIIDATVACIDRPDITDDELIEIVPGPDFPTAGYIFGRQGIHSAYRTGRGIIKMRAKADIELDDKGDEKSIAVTELPYQVNKARLLERIAGLVRDKKIEGIRDLRDESDRRGMRIYIELKKGAMGHIVLNKLFAMTPMQSTFGIINLAIVDGQPRVLTLKELLLHFINHRRDVVTRRCRFELRKAEARAHILEGYLIALENIDEVVELIKSSPTPVEARGKLAVRFSLSEIQAQSILDMRLQRLTGLEVDKIKAEYADIQLIIERLRAILASDDLLMEVIVNELRAIQDKFGDVRRTAIIDASGSIGMEDLIADEDMVVTTTSTGYIKRTPLSEYRTQKRGGRGRSGMSTKEEDAVSDLFVASAHTLLLIFTDRGQVYPLKVWELPQGGLTARGKALVNLIPLESDEQVKSVVAVDDLDRQDRYLIFSTRKGVAKRTRLDQYRNVRNSGIRAINLDDDDDLVGVALAAPGARVMLVTALGMSIMFPLGNVRSVGRASRGVRGIRMRNDEDFVVAMDVIPPEDGEETPGDNAEGITDESGEGAEEVAETDEEPVAEDLSDDDEPGEGGDDELEADDAGETVLLITEFGYGKRVPLEHFRVQNRGGLGLKALPPSDRNGPVAAMQRVHGDDDLMIVTDGGTIIRTPIADVRVYSRYARGVRIIRLGPDERVVSINAVPASEEEDEDELMEGEALEGAEDGALDVYGDVADAAASVEPGDDAETGESASDVEE